MKKYESGRGEAQSDKRTKYYIYSFKPQEKKNAKEQEGEERKPMQKVKKTGSETQQGTRREGNYDISEDIKRMRI